MWTLFLLKWVVCFFIGYIIYDVGYKKGKKDLWNYFSREYVVLKKGSYCCNGNKIIKKERKIK